MDAKRDAPARNLTKPVGLGGSAKEERNLTKSGGLGASAKEKCKRKRDLASVTWGLESAALGGTAVSGTGARGARGASSGASSAGDSGATLGGPTMQKARGTILSNKGRWGSTLAMQLLASSSSERQEQYSDY